MRIVNTFYDFEFEFNENEILVLTVENPETYSILLYDLWSQYEGGEGSFIFSDNEKEIKLSTKSECIYNPFSIDCNNKKIITKLYQELKSQSDTFIQEDTVAVRKNIIEYMDKLIATVPYGLKYNFDADIVNMIKAYDIKFDSEADTLLEKIIEYMRIISSICNINIFIFNDIKHYFSIQEINYLYEFAIYNKLYIVIIEPTESYKNSSEKRWIIDKDLCIIEV